MYSGVTLGRARNAVPLIAIAVAMTIGVSACATIPDPTYQFSRNQKKALLRLEHTQNVEIQTNDKYYNLPQPNSEGYIEIPSGKRITLSESSYFDQFNFSYSCYPSLSFIPKTGKKYIFNFYVHKHSCYVELVKEDNSTRTGVSIELSAPLSSYDWKDTCEFYAQMAQTIMNRRQSGVPMPKLINAFKSKEILKTITRGAYKEPRFKTPKMQRQAAENFRKQNYQACAKSLGPQV